MTGKIFVLSVARDASITVSTSFVSPVSKNGPRPRTHVLYANNDSQKLNRRGTEYVYTVILPD